MSTTRFRRRVRTHATLLAVPAALSLALAGCGSVPESEAPGDVPAPTSEAPAPTTDAGPTTEAPAPTTDAGPTTEAPAPTTDAGPTTEAPAPTTDAGPTTEAPPTQGGGGQDEPTSETGSLESPIPLGSTVEVGDWTVTIDSFEKDATAALSAPDVGNPGPPEGSQYSLLSVTATYNGQEEGSAFIDLWFELLGPDGVPTSDTEGEFCSAGSSDLIGSPNTPPGETLEGQVCFIVASEDIDSSVLLVEELISMGREGSYYVALD